MCDISYIDSLSQEEDMLRYISDSLLEAKNCAPIALSIFLFESYFQDIGGILLTSMI